MLDSFAVRLKVSTKPSQLQYAFSTDPTNYGVLLRGDTTLRVDLPAFIGEGSALKLTLASLIDGSIDDLAFGSAYSAISADQKVSFLMLDVSMPSSGPLVLILGE